MARFLSALLCGALFGAGLLVSGMVDTLKVQGWLDVFGDWDPTLAFVMGGAILPMAIAWRVAAGRATSVLGAQMPAPPRPEVRADLVVGSVIFGAGWALAGLCPGPALASVSFGGIEGLVFLVAMGVGMAAMPTLRARFFAPSQQLAPGQQPATEPSRRTKMDLRALTDSYSVSPQIAPEDFAAIKAAGYAMVIDNRPDGEISAALHGPQMRQMAEAQGLDFVLNPIIGGAMTMENVKTQAEAVARAKGPVLAYCASGNRSSVVWALMNAGQRPVDELIGIPARFGYNLEPLRPQIEALAAK